MPSAPSSSAGPLLDATGAAGFSPRGGSAEAWVPLPRGEWRTPSHCACVRAGTAWGKSYPPLLMHPGVFIGGCARRSPRPANWSPGGPVGGSRQGATEQGNVRRRKVCDRTDWGQEATRCGGGTRAVTEAASKRGGQEGSGRQAARDDLQGPEEGQGARLLLEVRGSLWDTLSRAVT